MIYVHEAHDVMGEKVGVFGEAVRDVWRPLVEEDGTARLLWFWELTHGTGVSYRALSLTAVRDWTAWGAIVDRGASDPRMRDWLRLADSLRKDVTAKVLVPTSWSPMQDVDLAKVPAPGNVAEPTLYLHDTGWPFPGMLPEYVDALGRILKPQEQTTRMMSISACFTVAPGTGKRHEAVILQRIDDWARFDALLRLPDRPGPRGGWMEAALHYRDRWESMLLRCATWSPMQ